MPKVPEPSIQHFDPNVGDYLLVLNLDLESRRATINFQTDYFLDGSGLPLDKLEKLLDTPLPNVNRVRIVNNRTKSYTLPDGNSTLSSLKLHEAEQYIDFVLSILKDRKERQGYLWARRTLRHYDAVRTRAPYFGEVSHLQAELI